MTGSGDETFRDFGGGESQNDPLGIIGWTVGGKYRIRSYIGGGGFGEVYDGYNVNLPEQKLVIKFFKRVQSRDKFAKEAKILCLLDHPNILRIIDYLPEEGALVVPFIDGKDGATILKESGVLQEKLFLRVARAMTDALAYAHEKKIAHRDLKPGNILIDKNEHIYLIDFGIAKEMGGSATKTAYVALTPLFAAPERQSGDQDYNPFLSDIYELGVTLFNFATNEMPYRNPSHPNPNEWGGATAIKRLSPELRRILRKATNPDPSERYATASDFAREIRNLDIAFGGGKGKSKIIAIAAAVVVVAGGAYLASQFLMKEPSQTNTAEQQAVVKKEEPKPAPNKPEDSQQGVKVIASPPEETKKEEPKPLTAAPKDTVTATPVKPPMPNLTVRVVPQFNATLYVDGRERALERRIEMEPGRHEIRVLHPDYPLLIDTLDVSVDKSHEYNLTSIYEGAQEVNFRIGVVPDDLKDASLQVSFNGKRRQFKNEELPVLDWPVKIGRWQMRFDITTAARTAKKIDSLVTFPHGGGPRVRFGGNSATVDFGDARWQNLENIDVVIYWQSH